MTEIIINIPDDIKRDIEDWWPNRRERLRRFKTPDEFVGFYVKKISTLCEKAIQNSELNVQQVELTPKKIDSDPLEFCAAKYCFHKSDNRKVAILLNFYYSLHSCLVSPSELKTTILHELYHHKDRWFLGYERAVLDKVGNIYIFNDEGHPIVDFLSFGIKYLLNVRTEGFATFCSTHPKISKQTLRHQTNNVKRLFEYLESHEVDYKEFLKYRKSVSSYDQGEAVFYLLNLAKRDIEQIKMLPLNDFFDVFYKSLNALGLEEKYSIIPEHLARPYLSCLKIVYKF